jgi:hypothetical protein
MLRWNPITVQQPNRVVLLFAFLFVLLAGLEAQADPMPEYRNTVEVTTGGYYLKSPTSSALSAGSFVVSYGYNISARYQAGLAYQNILSGSGSVGSSISGFDLFGNYCFFNCVVLRTDAGGMASIQVQETFGLSGGLGFAQRSFQLSTQSVGFAGPFGKITAHYFWRKNFKFISVGQFSYLSNGDNRLTFATLSVGIGVDW